MLMSIVMFYMARPICSQKINPHSQEMPEDVAISPSSDFDYVEAPDEAPFEEADSPAMEYDRELAHHYSDKQLKFLEACSEKPSSKCGNEVFKNMSSEIRQNIITKPSKKLSKKALFSCSVIVDNSTSNKIKSVLGMYFCLFDKTIYGFKFLSQGRCK